MPNIYASIEDIKTLVPGKTDSFGIDYDNLFLTVSDRCSRIIDRYCRRTFFPLVATKYFNGDGTAELWIPDLLTITSISYSDDDGVTYTALAATDYYLTVSGDFNSLQSFNKVILNVDGNLGVFPDGQRSVKIVGIWGYAENTSSAWEDSQDTVEDNPLSSSTLTILVNDADGLDLSGVIFRFQIGQLLRIENEYVEIRDLSYPKNTLTVIRGRNASTAASHVQNTIIEIWRPPASIRQAAIALSLEMIERSFYDLRTASSRSGTQFRLQAVESISAEIKFLLDPFKKMAVG